MASPIHGKLCGISSLNTHRDGNGSVLKQEDYGPDDEAEIRSRRQPNTGSGDYGREWNQTNRSGAVTKGDGESQNYYGEEMRRTARKFQIYGPSVHMVR